MKKTMQNKLTNVLIVIMVLAGVGLFLYPSIGQMINQQHQSKIIADYDEASAMISEEKKQAVFETAQSYNQSLVGRTDGRFTMSDAESETYASLLSESADGIMGYVSIPSIHVSLPIYHGTDESSLQSGAGHLPGSSLPVGGTSTNAVIAAHSGLASAKMFTDLSKLEIGDCFSVSVLGRTANYAVDEILTVDPEDTEALQIIEGEDHVTLLTCTPYGINTHRLLVRGTRTEAAVSAASGFTFSKPMFLISFLIILLTGLLLKRMLKRRRFSKVYADQPEPIEQL